MQARMGRLKLTISSLVLLTATLSACKTRPGDTRLLSDDSGGDDLTAALLNDQKAPLSQDQISTAPQAIQAAASGGSLDAAASQALLTAVQANFKDCRFTGIETPLFAKIKTALHQPAIAYYQDKLASFHEQGFSRVGFIPAAPAWGQFAAYVHEMDCLGIGLSDIWPEARSPKQRFYLHNAREAATTRAFFQQIAWSPKAPALPDADSDGNFLRNLTGAMEFIDFTDLLVNMVPNAPMIYPRQNRAIWTIYDTEGASNLQGWRAAATMTDGKSNVALKDFYGIISGRGAGFAFRQTRVVGGGDLGPTPACATAGAKTWKSNTKFFQATRRQVGILRTNPLVATQWCEDGGQDLDAGVIAQYEYPSAKTYAFPVKAQTAIGLGQQPAQFAPLLSEGLRAQLDQAKAAGKLDSDESPESKALTQAIITELVAAILKGWDQAALQNPASYPYQLLMSTHPADDFNGRSLRAWYRAHESLRSAAVAASGVPLFLLDFNLDLFTSPEEFFEVSLVAAREWGRMMGAFMQERSGGHKYYDVLLPWQVVSSCDLAQDNPTVLTRVRAWMSTEDHLNLVRTKQKFSVDQGLKAAVKDLCPQ